MKQRERLERLWSKYPTLREHGTMSAMTDIYDGEERIHYVDITMTAIGSDGLVEYGFWMQENRPLNGCGFNDWRFDDMLRYPMRSDNRWYECDTSWHPDLESCFDLANQIAEAIVNQN